MNRTGWRRVWAFGVDCVLITAWAGLLAAISFGLGAGGGGSPSEPSAKVVYYIVALVTLTIPVILVSALLEHRSGATPGKRLLRLHVADLAGPSLAFSRSLLRNVVKYAPWELGHIGIWIVPGAPFHSPPTGWSLALWASSMGTMVAQAALIVTTGKGIHDRVAGTRVLADRA
jgi:uncharacterized RDD family membrane protein YckC